MLSAIFEARPSAGRWNSYLDQVRLLRPELEQMPGFIGISLYRSLARDGWMLSLAGFEDEQAMLRWRRLSERNEGSANDGGALLAERRLRAGPVAFDTGAAEAGRIAGRDIEELEASGKSAVTMIDGLQWPDWVRSRNPEEIALYLGFDPYSYGDCISWDVLESISSPGAIILVASWKGLAPALDFAQSAMVPDDARTRVVGGVREYGAEGLAVASDGAPGDPGPGTPQGAANDR
jgi:heme-degrading monooxygenase HmoA